MPPRPFHGRGLAEMQASLILSHSTYLRGGFPSNTPWALDHEVMQHDLICRIITMTSNERHWPKQDPILQARCAQPIWGILPQTPFDNDIVRGCNILLLAAMMMSKLMHHPQKLSVLRWDLQYTLIMHTYLPNHPPIIWWERDIMLQATFILSHHLIVRLTTPKI